MITQNGLLNYIGTYKNLEEAQKIAKELIEIEEKRKNTMILELPIKRNEKGQAIIPIKTKNSIIYSNVSDETWHDLMRFSFRLDKNGYPIGNIDGKTITMHLYLFRKYKGEIPDGYVIDHWGNDESDSSLKKLNNDLRNLRAISKSQNSQNRIVSKNATSQYLGVSKKNNKWWAFIGYQKKSYYLGLYSTEIEAAKSYNSKAIELYGPDAMLNLF